MSERNIVKQLSEYYREVMSVAEEHGEEEIRLSVVASFVDAYMGSIYQAIYKAETEEERLSAVFAMEMMSNIQDDLSALTEDMTVEDKTNKLVDALTDIHTPSYDKVVSNTVRIRLIDTAKDDFTSMAEFLAG